MEKITLPKKKTPTELICCVFIDLAPSLTEVRHAVIPLLVLQASISHSLSLPAAARASGRSSRGSSKGPHPPWVLLSGLREQPISWPHQPLLVSCCQPRASRSMVAFGGPQRSEGSCSRGKERMETGCMYCERFRSREWKGAFGWRKLGVS